MFSPRRCAMLLASLCCLRTTLEVRAVCPDGGCEQTEYNDTSGDILAGYAVPSSAPGRSVHESPIQDVDFGAPQLVTDDDASGTVRRALRDSLEYMERLRSDPTYDDAVRERCVNHSENCTSWAAMGLCERNAPFTPLFCAPACLDCGIHDVTKRCPVDPDGVDSLAPGDLNTLFERVVSDPVLRRRHRPRALSRPPAGPWVVELANFADSNECERLINYGYASGYEDSMETGPEQPGGSHGGVVSSARTSSTAWCDTDCEDDSEVGALAERMAQAVGLPRENAEHMQLLRYQRGEYYIEHHDFVPHEVERPYGVRVLTAYLYLNDVVAGGGTRFPRLGNLTVYPEKGKMLLWANTLDESPTKRDDRTMHEALPVERGEKYGANVWIHIRDFREPMERLCHL